MQVEISAMIEDYDILAYVSENKQAKVIDNIFYECAEESRREFIHGLDDSYLIEELEERGFTITKKRTTMDNKVFDFHEIKTFADACMRLGISAAPLLVNPLGDTEAFLQANAFYKLMIIQKAINGEDFCDKTMRRFYPYWKLYTAEDIEQHTQAYQREGIRFISSYSKNLYMGISKACSIEGHYVGKYLNKNCCCSFCFNSQEAALYAAHQFEDLFFQYYGIKVKA